MFVYVMSSGFAFKSFHNFTIVLDGVSAFHHIIVVVQKKLRHCIVRVAINGYEPATWTGPSWLKLIITHKLCLCSCLIVDTH